ncbi:MAG: SsrA-binding protein SmpB [Clostridia bacterium]|nr:SsrA-binding protein SmpB [Clostridia bacterium]
MAEKKAFDKNIAQNRKAYHDYFVEETYEAGIALYGTEVKSLRLGRVNLKDSYCSFKKGELFVLGLHISPYDQGNQFNHDPLREKKLLLHKQELRKLVGLLSRDGYTLVPLSLYFSGNKVKMAIGLCKGKKLYDKRESIARAEAERSMSRIVKENALRGE